MAAQSWGPRHSGISTQRLEPGKEGSSFQSGQGRPGFYTRRALCSGDAQCGWKERVPLTTCILSVSGKNGAPPHVTSSDKIFTKIPSGDVLLMCTQGLINLSKTTDLWSEKLGLPSHRATVLPHSWDRAMTEAHGAESSTSGDTAGPCM